MCIAQVAATDQENVFGPLAQRGDLGCLQVGAMLGQRIGHGVQQAWAVGGNQREDEVRPLFVGPDADLRLDRKMLDLPR